MLAKLITWIEQTLSAENVEGAEPNLDAVTAVLYIELLRADHEIQEAELTELKALLSAQFSLSTTQVSELIASARHSAEESADVVQFTRVINDQCSVEQKRQLIENLWRLTYADNHLDGHEEFFIRKVADLIYVSHSDFIRSKLKVKPS